MVKNFHHRQVDGAFFQDLMTLPGHTMGEKWLPRRFFNVKTMKLILIWWWPEKKVDGFFIHHSDT